MPRKIRVNSYLRKGRLVRHHSRTYTISPQERKVFTHLSKLPMEVGGQLDFEKGRLENAKMHVGTESNTEWEYNPDYEVSYHTHPNLPGSSILPSMDDITSMKTGKEKAQIIFSGDKALSIATTPKFDKVTNKQISKVSNKLQFDYESGKLDNFLVKKYTPEFKDLGLDLELHNPDKKIEIKVKQ